MINRRVFPRDPLCYARGDSRKSRRILHELKEDFPVRYAGKSWLVPEGFHTDGASIPQIAYSIAGGPYSDSYVFAAFWHDLMYCVHSEDWYAKLKHLRHHEKSWKLIEEYRRTPMPRVEVDRIFRELMVEAGQPRYRALYFYLAVRANVMANWRKDI